MTSRPSFGKIRAPEVKWDERTPFEVRRVDSLQRRANYAALRAIGHNSGTWWQRLKRDVRLWLNSELW